MQQRTQSHDASLCLPMQNCNTWLRGCDGRFSTHVPHKGGGGENAAPNCRGGHADQAGNTGATNGACPGRWTSASKVGHAEVGVEAGRRSVHGLSGGGYTRSGGEPREVWDQGGGAPRRGAGLRTTRQRHVSTATSSAKQINTDTSASTMDASSFLLGYHRISAPFSTVPQYTSGLSKPAIDVTFVHCIDSLKSFNMMDRAYAWA